MKTLPQFAAPDWAAHVAEIIRDELIRIAFLAVLGVGFAYWRSPLIQEFARDAFSASTWLLSQEFRLWMVVLALLLVATTRVMLRKSRKDLPPSPIRLEESPELPFVIEEQLRWNDRGGISSAFIEGPWCPECLVPVLYQGREYSGQPARRVEGDEYFTGDRGHLVCPACKAQFKSKAGTVDVVKRTAAAKLVAARRAKGDLRTIYLPEPPRRV